METWQKNQINRNMRKLVESTVCNRNFLTILEETKLLTGAAIQTINSTLGTDEQAKLLYSHIKWKPSGYINLMKALFQTNQTIPLKILLEGLPTVHFLNHKINFLGKITSLRDILNDGEITNIKLALLTKMTSDKFLNLFVNSENDTFSIIKDIPPPSISKYMYIPRSLLPRQRFSVNSTNTRIHYNIVSENEFIKLNHEYTFDNGVCIYAPSGTGKSSLLGNLARKMSQWFPETIVVLISAVDFKDTFKRLRRQSTISVNGITSSEAQELLCEIISPSSFTQSLLATLLESRNVPIHLFLDELDQLTKNDVIFTLEILRNIQTSFKNILFYIALSENNFNIQRCCDGFVSSLKLKSFDLRPVRKIDQVDFLQKLWKDYKQIRKGGGTQDLKLEQFATFCIQRFRLLITSRQDEEEITEKLKLLGAIYAERAFQYSQQNYPHSNISSSVSVDAEMFPTTILGLYNKFIEHKIKEILKLKQMSVPTKYCLEPPFETLDTPEIKTEKRYIETEDLRQYFRWLALKKVFPDYTQNIINIPTLTCTNLNVDLSDIGLDHSLIFDYLVGEYFAKLIIQATFHFETDFHTSIAINYFYDIMLEPQEYGITTLMTKYTRQSFSTLLKLYCFKHPKILSFINAHFEEYYQNGNSMSEFSKLGKKCFQYIVQTNSKRTKSTYYLLNRLYEILQCCVFHNFHRIFMLIAEIFVNLSEHDHRNNYLEDRKPYEILMTACMFGHLKLVRECFNLFMERCCHFNKKYIFVRRNKSNSYTCLHIAMQNLDCDMVELLGEKFPPLLSLEKLGLVQEFVLNTYRDSIETVKKKVYILKLLARKSKMFVKEMIDFSTTASPLMQQTVHLDLLKLLIKEGADVRIESCNNKCSIFSRLGGINISNDDYSNELNSIHGKTEKEVEIFKTINVLYHFPTGKVDTNQPYFSI